MERQFVNLDWDAPGYRHEGARDVLIAGSQMSIALSYKDYSSKAFIGRTGDGRASLLFD